MPPVSALVQKLAADLHAAYGRHPVSGQIVLNYNEGRLSSVELTAHERVPSTKTVDNPTVDRAQSVHTVPR